MRFSGGRWRWLAIVQIILIACLIDGSTVPASATDPLRERAEQGDGRAEQLLGWSYHTGAGEPKDDAQAVFWLQKAADQGDVAAEFEMGDAYYEGWGVPQNLDTGLEMYRKAAEWGSAPARGALRTLYIYGKLVPTLDAQAGPWWRQFTKEVGAETTAFSKALAAAEKGDAKAQLRLGRFYLTGVGTVRDQDKAAIWLGRAADGGQLEAQCIFATLTTAKAGWENASDNARAVDLCLKAGSKGSADAQEILYYASEGGLGAAQSATIAVAWLRKAAEQGRADAEKLLGDAYRYGDGVPKDEDQAFLWYSRAADQNEPGAFLKLSNVKGHIDGPEFSRLFDLSSEYYPYISRDFLLNVTISPQLGYFFTHISPSEAQQMQKAFEKLAESVGSLAESLGRGAPSPGANDMGATRAIQGVPKAPADTGTPTVTAQAQSPTNKEIIDTAIARIEPHGDWDHIQISEAEGSHYWVRLFYRGSDPPIHEVEADTRLIAEMILSEIKHAGTDPHDRASIHVMGKGSPRPIRDEMTSPTYGMTDYFSGGFTFEDLWSSVLKSRRE